jgi:hypothetical protein
MSFDYGCLDSFLHQTWYGLQSMDNDLVHRHSTLGNMTIKGISDRSIDSRQAWPGSCPGDDGTLTHDEYSCTISWTRFSQGVARRYGDVFLLAGLEDGFEFDTL